MTRRALWFVLCLSVSGTATAHAQECVAASAAPASTAQPCKPRTQPHVDEVPDVASLKTPEAPALMALGLAPTEIQRPTTPTGLKASLANGFVAGGALPLLQNFALEVSPYWLFPHRKLSYEKVVAERGKLWWRNLSFSFATGPRELARSNADGSSTKLNYGNFAVGGRSTLYPGWETRVAKQCVAYIKHTLEGSAAERAAAIDTFMTNWQVAHPSPEATMPKPDVNLSITNPPEWTRQKSAYERALAEALLPWAQAKELASEEFERSYLATPKLDDARYQRCLADIHAREGFMAELAGAYAFGVPRGNVHDFKDNALQTTTGWLTVGWVQEDFAASGVEGSALVVFRVQGGRGALTDPDQKTQLFDTGLRLATAFSRVGIAVEGTLRVRKLDPSTGDETTQKLWRTALTVDYRLASGIWLTGTFGKDFGGKDDTPILALANVQWNFGVERGVKPDRGVTQ